MTQDFWWNKEFPLGIFWSIYVVEKVAHFQYALEYTNLPHLHKWVGKLCAHGHDYSESDTAMQNYEHISSYARNSLESCYLGSTKLLKSL